MNTKNSQDNNNIRQGGLVAKVFERKFSKGMQKKLVVLFVVVLLVFVGLSVVLFGIVRNQGDRYAKTVLAQQDYESKAIPCQRGEIQDRNGTILATSLKVYNVILDVKMLLAASEKVEPTLDALVTAFGFDKAAMKEYIEKYPDSQYYVLAKKKTYDEISAFLEMQQDTEQYPDITGVWFEDSYTRSYPFGSLACDVIGFTAADGTPMNGLEEYYNTQLSGISGRVYGYLDSNLDLQKTMIAPQDGYTIHSTIDVTIQGIVEKYISKFLEEHQDEFREGAGASNIGCIIMDPNTGEILAMADSTQYDLNNPRDLSAYYLQEEIAKMEQEETLYDAMNQMWRNFCISDTYEPGSVAKALTIAAGLESGRLTGQESYTCVGGLQVLDYYIRCNLTRGHGTLTVAQALAVSCNVCLMEMAEQIGKETLLQYLNVFNIGLRTNVDLIGESRTDTLVFSETNMQETELATSSFGQGYNVTMIQMITAYASLINGGYLYQPHLVSEIVNADGAVVEVVSPRVLKQTISSQTSQTIHEYLNGVVSEGTGGSARPAGYAIGGKTGTAEKSPRDKTNYVVSFMGYAPADDPQLLIYVVIDEPNVEDQPHSYYATEVVRSILTEVLPYMNIFRTEPMTAEEIQELVDLGLYRVEDDSLLQEEEQGTGTENGSEEGALPPANEADTTQEGDETGNVAPESDIAPESTTAPEDTYYIDPVTGDIRDSITGEIISGSQEALPDNALSQ